MQIVIDISDEEYEDVKKAGGCYYDFGKAIYYGTPLPKGHGRLIDADELIDSHNAFMREMKNNDEVCSCLKEVLDGMEIMLEMVDTAPTIIEATEK